MTGKDLIIYILQNDLENEDVFKNGKFIGFMTVGEAAVKFGVGEATINAWRTSKYLDSVIISNTIYIPANAKDPRKER